MPPWSPIRQGHPGQPGDARGDQDEQHRGDPLPGTIYRNPRNCTALYWDDLVSMGKQVSVYIRAEDLQLWERAERHARERRMPVSGLVLTAIQEYLDRHGEKPAGR